MKYRYQQIANELMRKIERGDLKVGDKLPGEIRLTKEYNVGRSTIREALNALEEQRLIKKRNGIGTFVIGNRPQINNPLLQLESVGKIIERAGFESGSIHHKTVHIQGEEWIVNKLGGKAEETIVVVQRERTADGRRVAISYHIFLESLVGNSLDEGITGGVLQQLEETYPIHIQYALSELRGIRGSNHRDQEASRLIEGAVILLEQLHFDQNNHPVFFSLDYINTDIVALNLRRERTW